MQDAPGLLHASGFTGGGFFLAPGVGEVLADLICDGETSTPLSTFSVDRFIKNIFTATRKSPLGTRDGNV
jgi:sarcosine oxidase, subunit beta